MKYEIQYMLRFHCPYYSRYRADCARSNTQSQSGEQVILRLRSPTFSTRKTGDFMRPSYHRMGVIIRTLWPCPASASAAISSADLVITSSERLSRNGNPVA